MPGEQTHRYLCRAQFAGGLEVVAGQPTKSARVDRQALGQPELQREVRDDHRRSGVHERRTPVVVLELGVASTRRGLLNISPLERVGDRLCGGMGLPKDRTFTSGRLTTTSNDIEQLIRTCISATEQ